MFVKREGKIYGHAVTSPSNEYCMINSKLIGNFDRPSQEHIRDDTHRDTAVLFGNVGEEAFEGRLEIF